MALIKSLCRGSSSLPKSDVVMFTAQLKSAKAPSSGKLPETGNVADLVNVCT